MEFIHKSVLLKETIENLNIRPDGIYVDENRIRLMTKLAICEKKGIEKDIQISGYYKKDYASLKKWITLIGITIGYGLAAALFAVCASDTLLEDLTFIKLVLLGVIVVGVYLALLILYGIGAGSFYKKKHQKAKENVRSYYRDLVKLEKVSKRRKAEHE